MRQPFYKVVMSATGLTILLQLLGLLRQSMTVAYFGLSRELDVFWTVYAMAAVSVFGFNTVVEAAYTAVLVKLRGEEGEAAYRGALLPYSLAALVFGAVAGLIFVISAPLLAFIYCSGFTDGEREQVGGLLVWFVPWVLALAPYYAISAVVKTSWSFNWAFAGELIAMGVSVLMLVVSHGTIQDLPLAYGIGYWAAIAWLLLRVVAVGRGRCDFDRIAWREVARRVVSHLSAFQSASLYSLAERFWMSYLPAGGIAAIGIVQQLTMGLSGVLGLRDSYMVHLATDQGREARLLRLLVGMALMSCIACSYVAAMAPEIGGLLFHYGRVSRGDIDLIATLLSIGAIGVIPATLGMPIWRTLQMGGRHGMFVTSFAFNAVSMMLCGWLLIGEMHLGAAGIVGIGVFNSFVSLIFAFKGLDIRRLTLSKSILSMVGAGAALSVTAALLASVVARETVAGFVPVLGVSALLYGIAIAMFGLFYRRSLGQLIRPAQAVE